MNKLYQSVQAVLARGPRTTDEITAECRRAGVNCRPETIRLFLHLSREAVERDGTWRYGGGSKHDRVLAVLQKAFSSGQAYLPLERLSQYLEEGELITADEIAMACTESGQYRVHGTLVLRTR